MKSFKKVITVTLFLSLIACFVLYRADVFTFEKIKDSSKLIVSNVPSTKIDVDNDKRLIVDYVLQLIIDTTYITAEKKVVKTFTLETWDSELVSSTKSLILYKHAELPRFTSKNDSIKKKLKALKIKRIRFTTNKVFDGENNDTDLLEAIELVENKTLRSNSSLEQHINNQEKVDFYWNRFKNYKIEVNYVNNKRGVLVDRVKVDSFLKTYEALEKLKVKKRSEIISSSKSIQLYIDEQEIENPSSKYLIFRNSFKVLVENDLGVKL